MRPLRRDSRARNLADTAAQLADSCKVATQRRAATAARRVELSLVACRTGRAGKSLTEIATYSVSPEAAGQRLDAWLAARLDGVSRSRVQMLLSQGSVFVDGKPVKASFKLRGGEAVEVHGEPLPPPLRAMAEAIPLDILYEDDDL